MANQLAKRLFIPLAFGLPVAAAGLFALVSGSGFLSILFVSNTLFTAVGAIFGDSFVSPTMFGMQGQGISGWLLGLLFYLAAIYLLANILGVGRSIISWLAKGISVRIGKITS